MTPRSCLVFVAVAGLLATATGVCRAERAVGLEASGIDPRVALENVSGLDVRDDMGRPVSARLIEQELKAAQASASAEASFSSKLPMAKVMARALELWEGLKESLSRPVFSFPWREFWALSASKFIFRTVLPTAALLAVLVFCLAAFLRGRSFLARP
jgi:hypothetical protein